MAEPAPGFLRRLSRVIPNRLADLIERLYPKWNADAAWRYLPIAQLVAKTVGPSATVLDVGAGAVGIAPYFPNPCILTDRHEAGAPLAPFICADASALPFRDKSFDAVVSADLLEHVPPSERAAVVREMFRLARRLVVLAVPAGPAAEAHDRRLLDEAHPESDLRRFLGEHLEHGLPTEDELRGLCTELAQATFASPRVEIRRNANLWLRYRMMRGIVRSADWGAIIRLRFWTPLAPLLAQIERGACYRVIVVCAEGGTE